jgi:hypothetical protein
LRIVDPTYGTPVEEELPGPVRNGEAAGVLCLFSNSKPGANELLTGVGQRLAKERGFADIGFAAKPNAAAGADTVIIDHLAEQYRMAVVAIGD